MIVSAMYAWDALSTDVDEKPMFVAPLMRETQEDFYLALFMFASQLYFLFFLISSQLYFLCFRS